LAAVWFLVAIALERAPRDETAVQRFRVYRLVWSAIGLAAVVWAVVIGRSNQVPAQYHLIEAAIAGIFVYAAVANETAVFATARFVWTDFVAFAGRTVTWAATVAGAVVLACGPQQIETENIRSGADFEAWFLAQPRVPFPVSHEAPGVLVAEFIDYQCPDCRARDARYQKLFRDLRSRHGDSLRVVRYDFPLERECNQSPRMRDVHPAACEAAAAVRMAREHGKDTAMQDWLWRNQDRLSRELIFQHLRDVVGVDDPAARYRAVLPNVTADAAVGAALSIKSTPTLWVNGVLLSAVSERSLRWAIAHELQQVQLTRATTSSPHE
jgi:hypothetical protein